MPPVVKEGDPGRRARSPHGVTAPAHVGAYPPGTSLLDHDQVLAETLRFRGPACSLRPRRGSPVKGGPPDGLTTKDREEVRRLEWEVRRLRMERDILKNGTYIPK